ncbi:hypothetical protein C8J56DRAFT_135401 [Mycena floridula]|nr:hypothetical protein C8J56DRAFT_135401 [Mycena floridula]
MAAAASPPSDELVAQIIQALHHKQIISYVDVIGCAVFLYDYTLTLEREISLIWGSGWSFMRVLYTLQRYLPFVDTICLTLFHQFATGLSTEACTEIYQAAIVTIMCGFLVSQVILTVRIWAVWHRGFAIAVALGLVLLGVLGFQLMVAIVWIKSVVFTIPPVPYQGCFVAAGSRILVLFWVSPMVFDFVCFVLMTIPAIKSYRTGGNSALMTTVYRDGVVYYLYIFLFTAMNVVVVTSLPTDLMALFATFERGMYSILTSRTVLRIREVGSQNRYSAGYGDGHGAECGIEREGLYSSDLELQLIPSPHITIDVATSMDAACKAGKEESAMG